MKHGGSLILNVASNIVVATVFYELIEKNILKYKSRFTLIKSGKIRLEFGLKPSGFELYLWLFQVLLLGLLLLQITLML